MPIPQRRMQGGREVFVKGPVEIPAGFKVPETLEQKIARMVFAREFQQKVEAAGAETFEESNDFDVPDDPIDFNSPWEEDFDKLKRFEEDYKKLKEAVNEKKKRQTKERQDKSEPVVAGPTTGQPSDKKEVKSDTKTS